MTAYNNGFIPKSVLMRMDNGLYLSKDAGTSFNFARDDLKRRAGLNLYDFVTNWDQAMYRDFAAQVQAKKDDPTSAFPGTSNHGWGDAVDLGNGGSYNAAVIAVMAAHGWRRDGYTGNYPNGEPWHWHFLGTDPAGGNITPIPEYKRRVIHMWYVQQKNSAATKWSVDDVNGKVKKLADQNTNLRLLEEAGAYVERKVSGDAIKALQASFRSIYAKPDFDVVEADEV